jgi:transcriptional regulator with XRE-family HTH domain
MVCHNIRDIATGFVTHSVRYGFRADLRPSAAMTTPLAIALKRTGKSQSELARLLDTDRQNVSRWASGKVKLPIEFAQKAALFLETSVEFLVLGDKAKRPLIDSFDPDAPDDEASPENFLAMEAAGRAARRELRPGEVIERDVRGGMGVGGFADPIVVDGQIVDGVRASWTVPVPFLHTELRAREHEVDIIPVDGDSMLPTLLPGDRVMIHRGAVAPSPDGIFAIDDGIGVSVKRLQIVRGSDPLMIRIMSDNSAHREDIVPADAIKVIGRVILKMSRL